MQETAEPHIILPLYHFSKGQVDMDRIERMDLKGDRFYNPEMEEGKPQVYELVVDHKFHEMKEWPVLEAICPIVLYYRPHPIVEIGMGVSSKVLAKVALEAGVELHSVDIKKEKMIAENENHRLYLMPSEAFMEYFNQAPAVVLIDGDHRYESAKKEFEFFFDILVPGGVIFLHDTYPPHEAMLGDTACGDVYKLRQELEERKDEMDILTFPYTARWCGLSVIMKKERDRPYWGK